VNNYRKFGNKKLLFSLKTAVFPLFKKFSRAVAEIQRWVRFFKSHKLLGKMQVISEKKRQSYRIH